MNIDFSFKLYVVSDSCKTLHKAILDGVTIIQLRDKISPIDVLAKKCKEIVLWKKNHKFYFIVNDNADLALEVGADGVHIGQDTETKAIRQKIGKDLILGKTTHNVEQAALTEQEGADYISAGPVYETPTKPGRKAVGLEYVREAVNTVKIPVVAIGGLNLSNLDLILETGVKTVAVVRDSGSAREIMERLENRKNAN